MATSPNGCEVSDEPSAEGVRLEPEADPGMRSCEVTTGGRYEFNSLPPGSYDLTIRRGSDFEMKLTARIEEQACFDAGYISVP